MEAPPILKLKDEEKFKDAEGNVLNIEVRGERYVDKCYFKMKNFKECLDLKNLDKVILNKNTDYEENKHYKYFISKKVKLVENNSNKKKEISNKKEMFLTYLGIVKVLFVSKNYNCEHFQNWAIKILFTHQLGTKEQKQILSHKLLGTPTLFEAH